ncbi:MAG: hypothetical protein ACRC23_02020 [Aeromonas jandaei]
MKTNKRVLQVTIDKKELKSGRLITKYEERHIMYEDNYCVEFIDFNTGTRQILRKDKEYDCTEYSSRITASIIIIGNCNIEKIKEYLILQMMVIQNNKVEYAIQQLEAEKKEKEKMSNIYKNIISILNIGDE